MRDMIQFDKLQHRYYYCGKELKGVTGVIGKRLGKKFGQESLGIQRVFDATEFGSMVHGEVESWIKQGVSPCNEHSRYVCDFLSENYPKSLFVYASELLVSDYVSVATAIDVVVIQGRKAMIFDIKTGVFDREYCSFQLGIGKMLLELDGDLDVVGAFVIATKDRFVYTINCKSEDRCRSLLGITKG